MSALVEVLRAHVPRDRYDDEGASVGTYCSCGGWEGDYFADGEAGPFDEHLAGVVLAWVAGRAGDAAVVETVAEALTITRDISTAVTNAPVVDFQATAALAAFVGTLGGGGDE